MNRRYYNVFFNTHTVSGIVISVALYVIFFAGAFALFKDEIAIWETGNPISHISRSAINYDAIFKKIDEDYGLTGRDIQLSFGHNSDKIYLFLQANKDSLASEKAKESHYFSVNINSFDTKTYDENYSLGEFLYRLHFFHQLPLVGIYLAGFIALFFLFAIVTGTIVHWEKIISNFYNFNPRIALKRVWADAHTALGVIGLPFQFMFAVTGAYFCLSILVLIPANFLYNNDQNKLMEDLRPARKSLQWEGKKDNTEHSFNQFAKQAENTWDNFRLTRCFIKNYGGVNMKYVIMGELEDSERFVGLGRLILDVNTGQVIIEKDPNTTTYTEDFQHTIGRLHFASFGGIAIKIVYFILALITCFVIISGVLIWIEARNKKSMSLQQRLYTAKVGHIYLAICLSMLPVTALSFLFIKIFGDNFSGKITPLYIFYFGVWLIATFYFRFKRNNYFTNRITLLSGAILGILVPVASGIVSGNWIWVSITNQQTEILIVDVLWVLIATTSLVVYFKIKPSVKAKSTFTTNPIDYKNVDKLLKEAQLTAHAKKSNHLLTDKNYISMRSKIIFLWILLAIFWLAHHIYGLFNIYYNETLVMDGATGKAPLDHHFYRILFEGFCLLFGLLTIELSKRWFKLLSIVWAIIAGLYNIYHFATAIVFEGDNISEIFMLLLAVVASIFLVINLNQWRKSPVEYGLNHQSENGRIVEVSETASSSDSENDPDLYVKKASG